MLRFLARYWTGSGERDQDANEVGTMAKDFASFPSGTHLVVSRLMYTHHGVYIGGGEVVHYTGSSRPAVKGPVERTSLQEFCRGSEPYKYQDYTRAYFIGARECFLRGKRLSSKEIVTRAINRIGENSYHLLECNCGQFANWCTHGDAYSVQSTGSLTGEKPQVWDGTFNDFRLSDLMRSNS